jgi:uncharacterized membrane protein
MRATPTLEPPAMTMLIAGLVIFLGLHSLRVFAEGWRTRTRERMGVDAWKGLYSVLSLAGLALIVWGYAAARQHPVPLWVPPVWSRHLASLLTLPAFILLLAAYVPGNAFKARLHHPMLLGVKFWALAHLLANGALADLLLFGGFLAWAALAFRAARRRDRADGVAYAAGRWVPTVVTGALGLATWAAFALWAHAAWIGVRPFG